MKPPAYDNAHLPMPQSVLMDALGLLTGTEAWHKRADADEKVPEVLRAAGWTAGAWAALKFAGIGWAAWVSYKALRQK